MKQYVGFIRDHSGSMYLSGLESAAMNDYNSCITECKENAVKYDIDTVVFTIKCGVGANGDVVHETVNSSIAAIKPLNKYIADGHATPLFDSAADLITMMAAVPDAHNKEVSFLIVVVTDGYENASVTSGTWLAEKIKELQRTDRWTFTFRVPNDNVEDLVRLGIPRGNILGWEQTKKGMDVSTKVTTQAFNNYYQQRKAGHTSTTTFYAQLGGVEKSVLNDVTDAVYTWPVHKDSTIRDFIQDHNHGKFTAGATFYQLTKSERVQSYKRLIIMDKANGRYYSGGNHRVRSMLGLPTDRDIRLRPAEHPKYEIYVQSTSVNRKLLAGTKVVYWE